MREFVNPQERKQKTEAFLEENGISYNKFLGTIDSSKEVTIKSKLEIFKRLIAGVFMQMHASTFGTSRFNESRIKTEKIIRDMKATYLLDDLEKQLLKKRCPEEVANGVYWNTEALVAICWALGLVKDEDMISTEQAGRDLIDIQVKACCMPMDEMVEKSTVRDIEDILDMLDLYFRYHWVLTEKMYAPNNITIKTGDLDLDVVIERRKALEWLISDVDNWSEVRMDT